MIVLVSSVGDWWIDEETARKVAGAMQKGTAYITIKGSMIATNAIRGLLQPDKYRTQAVNMKRNWTCSHGSGHAYNDSCQCKPKQQADLTKTALAETNPLTPEQQAEKKMRTDAQVAWIKSCHGNWKLAADKGKRDEYVDNFIKNYGKPIAITE